jgi:hypothetical protein
MFTEKSESVKVVVRCRPLSEKEMKEMNTTKSDDNFGTIMVTFALIAITTWIIVNGPRSSLFG